MLSAVFGSRRLLVGFAVVYASGGRPLWRSRCRGHGPLGAAVDSMAGPPGAQVLPADGAFYLYANVTRLTDDSFDFCKRLLELAGVAATPGDDFDPVRGKHYVRFCYAGSSADMREAVARIGKWVKS